MIYVSIVDDEEAVVAFRIGTYLNGRVLAIVLFKVETQVVAYLIRIDCAANLLMISAWNANI